MTIEAIGEIGGAALAGLSLLFGGGLFNRYLKHQRELAVAQYRLDEQKKILDNVVKKVDQLERDSVEVRVEVTQFREAIKKLDLIPTLNAKLEVLDDLVHSVQSLVFTLKNGH